MDHIIKKYQRQVPAVGQIHLPDQYPTFGIEVAPEYKYVKDNQYSVGLWYADTPHLYFMEFPNQMRMPLISVTTVIHTFSRPFDVEKMSSRCAMKDDYNADCLDKTNWEEIGISERQNRIKTAWSTNNKNATEYGTYAHAVMEGVTINPTGNIENIHQEMSDKYKIHYSYITTIAYIYRDEFLNPLIQEGWTVIAEPIVYNLSSVLAGQSDLVAIHHGKKSIKILDFKTNKVKPDLEKSYGNMLGELSHLKDTSYSHYCIQLCLYQRFVQSIFPDYTLEVNELLWIDRDAHTIVPVYIDPKDYQGEVNYILSTMRKISLQLFDYYQVNQYTNFNLRKVL